MNPTRRNNKKAQKCGHYAHCTDLTQEKGLKRLKVAFIPNAWPLKTKLLTNSSIFCRFFTLFMIFILACYCCANGSCKNHDGNWKYSLACHSAVCEALKEWKSIFQRKILGGHGVMNQNMLTCIFPLSNQCNRSERVDWKMNGLC